MTRARLASRSRQLAHLTRMIIAAVVSLSTLRMMGSQVDTIPNLKTTTNSSIARAPFRVPSLRNDNVPRLISASDRCSHWRVAEFV